MVGLKLEGSAQTQIKFFFKESSYSDSALERFFFFFSLLFWRIWTTNKCFWCFWIIVLKNWLFQRTVQRCPEHPDVSNDVCVTFLRKHETASFCKIQAKVFCSKVVHLTAALKMNKEVKYYFFFFLNKLLLLI